jgi:phenylalanyl-tRNA synthetase beta subunit
MKQRSLRRALTSCGFDEAISFSFIQQQSEFDLIPAFSGRELTQPELQNSIIEDASSMRSTLLPDYLVRFATI